MASIVRWSGVMAAALVLHLSIPDVSMAACRSRSTGRAASKRPLIINVPRQFESKPPCPQQPQSTCERTGSSRLVVSDSKENKNDLLVWKWIGSGALAEADVGEPSSTTSYALCIYDSFENVPLRIATLTVKPGGGWTRNEAQAWKYKDVPGASAGVTDLLLKSGSKGRTRVRIKAAGQRLRLPSPADRSRFFHKQGSVVVQLVNDSSGKCWTSTFATAKENSAASFVAP